MSLLGVLIGVAILFGLAIWYYNKDAKTLDVNNDGKVDVKDAKDTVAQIVEDVKTSVDANKDGKVDIADAVAVVEKVKAKKVAKPKVAAKKTSNAKPATETKTVKKPKLKTAK